jgi:hypothetical protein
VNGRQRGNERILRGKRIELSFIPTHEGNIMKHTKPHWKRKRSKECREYNGG